MAATAFRTVYNEEYVAGFEEDRSLLSASCTTNFVANGNTAYFLVADSGGATAVTRGANGLIPARSDNLTQVSCTLTEWHDLVSRTSFSLDFGQSDQRRIMQKTSMGVINRKMDDQIITALGDATNDTGTSATASINMVIKSLAILGNNEVKIEEEDNMFGLITPAFWGYLMQTPQFSSEDYVTIKAFDGPVRRYRRWMGINWVMHPNLSGVGTSTISNARSMVCGKVNRLSAR